MAPGSFRYVALLARWQLHAGAAGLGETNRDGLLGGAGSVFAFPDMMDFFTNKFSGLGCRAFSRTLLSLGPSYRRLFWHDVVLQAAYRPFFYL